MRDYASIRRGCLAVRLGFILPFICFAEVLSAASDAAVCTCSDGRQFAIGESLFGRSSARVVITGFSPDVFKSFETGRLPVCRDLSVLGQVIRVKDAVGRPFLKREGLKRGKIPDVCETKIQFTEAKKYYNFFSDDGNAVPLTDTEDERVPHPPVESPDAAQPSGDAGDDDLTGKDLIRLIPRERMTDDPAGEAFGPDELKDGAYFVVPKAIKVLSGVDDDTAGNIDAASLNPHPRPVTIWAGSLGRIQKRAGFRSEPLWDVELLPRSGVPLLPKTLISLPGNLRRKYPMPNRFTLPSSEIVEINRFLDQHAIEWTRFGDESDEARARDELGTTMLPSLYAPPALAWEDNLENANKAGTLEAMRATARELAFVAKASKQVHGPGMLVLDDETSLYPDAVPVPNFFHRQCFVDSDQISAFQVLRVADFDIRIFRPSESTQVPEDYYAVDLAMRLKSGSGESLRVVCRFPSAAIDLSLLEKAKRLLSSRFEVQRLRDNDRQ
jgi:hypothetical protein